MEQLEDRRVLAAVAVESSISSYASQEDAIQVSTLSVSANTGTVALHDYVPNAHKHDAVPATMAQADYPATATAEDNLPAGTGITSVVDTLNQENQAAVDKALELRALVEVTYRSEAIYGTKTEGELRQAIEEVILGDPSSVFEPGDLAPLQRIVDRMQYKMHDYGTSLTGAGIVAFEETSDTDDNERRVTVAINGTDLDFALNPIESIGDVANDVFLVGMGGPPPQVFEVIATLDQIKSDLDVEAFTITGHSLSGTVVQWVGMLRPDLVESAVVYNPPGVGGIAGTLLNWATFGTFEDIFESFADVTTYQVTSDIARLVGINAGNTQVLIDPVDDLFITSHTNGTLLSLLRQSNPAQNPDVRFKTDYLQGLFSRVIHRGTLLNTSIVGGRTSRTYELNEDGETARFVVDTEAPLGGVPKETATAFDGDGNEIGKIVVSRDSSGEAYVEIVAHDSNGNTYFKSTRPNAPLGSSPTIIIPNNKDIPFEIIGGKLGSYIAGYLSDGEFVTDALFSAYWKSAGEHFGTFARFVEAGFDIWTSWDAASGDHGLPAFSTTFVENFSTELNSRIASAFSTEFTNALDIDTTTFLGGAVSTAVDSATYQFIGESVDVIFDGADIFSEIADGGFFTKPVEVFNEATQQLEIQYETIDLKSIVGNALGSYAGTRLGQELIAPQSEIASVLGSLGAGLGSAISSGTILTSSGISTALSSLGWVGGPIVAAATNLAGYVFGTFVGNFFGGEDSPQSWANIGFNRDAAQFVVTNNWSQDGASAETAYSMARATIEGVNSIIGATGGNLRSTSRAPGGTIGVYKGQFETYIGGSFKAGSSGEVIERATMQLVKGFDLVGGHTILQRAWHNTNALTFGDFQRDIQVAEAFEAYVYDPAPILAMMVAEPNSDLAQIWSEILVRAEQLELHLPDENDLDGGWGEILLARGDIDPGLVPDIDGYNIVLTNPISGDELVLHGVLAPGISIVRLEGTMDNDFIEVVVEGPSITYVDAGEGDDVIAGSEAPDIIVGGPGDDDIMGREGNDWIHSGAGNDQVDGNGGEDLIYGGADDDVLIGSSGNDQVYGGPGNDDLSGGGGQDYLYGGIGDDVLRGDSDLDRLYGQDGNDTLVGGGNNRLYGGSGNDLFLLMSNSNRVIVGRSEGYDVVEAVPGTSNIVQFASSISLNELFFVREGDDLLVKILGEPQSVLLRAFFNTSYTYQLLGSHGHGLSGLGGYRQTAATISALNATLNETVSGPFNTLSDGALADLGALYDWNTIWTRLGNPNGFSAKPYVLGPQDDHHYYDNVGGWVQLSHYGGAGNDILEPVLPSDRVHAIHLFGDTGNDTLLGTRQPDLLVGGLGDDFLNGRHGDDKLFGGVGDDELRGNVGDDIAFGGPGVDLLLGSGGSDSLHGDEGDDQLFGEQDGDILEGGSGSDYIDGGVGDDILRGGEGDDQLLGGDGNDLFSGGSGDDLLDGGAGDDFISGGEGNDLLDPASGSDTVDGGDGLDAVDYSFATSAVIIDLSINKALEDGFGAIDELLNIEHIVGTAFDDSIKGDMLNNILTGGPGSDLLDGGAGEDVADYTNSAAGIKVKLGLSIVDDGVGGTDHLVGIEHINGTSHADFIVGNSFTNTLDGAAGDDILFGDASVADFDQNGRIDQGDKAILDAEYHESLGSPATNGDSSSTSFHWLADADRDGSVGDLDFSVFYESLGQRYLVNPRFGDFNHDGLPNLADYSVWRDNLGSSQDSDADGNGDGIVDLLDKALWRQHFGTPVASPAPDVLRGGGGADILFAGYYGSLLVGGVGSDVLIGNLGRDVFLWNPDDIDGEVDLIRNFDPTDEDTIDVSQILRNTFDPSRDALEDFVRITHDGNDSLISVAPNGDQEHKPFVRLVGVSNLAASAIIVQVNASYEPARSGQPAWRADATTDLLLQPNNNSRPAASSDSAESANALTTDAAQYPIATSQRGQRAVTHSPPNTDTSIETQSTLQFHVPQHPSSPQSANTVGEDLVSLMRASTLSHNRPRRLLVHPPDVVSQSPPVATAANSSIPSSSDHVPCRMHETVIDELFSDDAWLSDDVLFEAVWNCLYSKARS